MAKKITDTKVKKIEGKAPEKISAGEAYKIERDAKAAKSYRMAGGPKKKDKGKDHAEKMAMMQETTARIRARRSKMREQLPKFGGK